MSVTKKIIVSISVVLASILLLFSICLVVLFLAPGTEILGVRYVASGISEFEDTFVLDSKEFSGDIYIETHNVPVVIDYTTYYTSSVEYKQDFIGLTKDKKETASWQIDYVDREGQTIGSTKKDVHIKVDEIQKWGYAHDNGENFYLHAYLGVQFRDRNIHVISDNSKIKIVGNILYDTLEVKSSRTLSIEGSLFAENLIYHTGGNIEIGNTLTCTNADLSSTDGKITINQPVGDLKATTNSGNIRFISCASLDVTTKSGDVLSAGEGLTSVSGNVNITTKTGKIEIGNIKSQTETPTRTTIKSSSGSINITSMENGEIEGGRGKVNISSAHNLIVSTTIGAVKVDEVTGGIIVNGKNGKVTLGAVGRVNNPVVRTTTGKIEVYHAQGIVDLTSSSNSITFENALALGSMDINLVAGRKLVAKNLQGRVKAEANGNVEMSFLITPISLDLNIKSRGNSAEIDMNCTDFRTINYHLYSSKGKKNKLVAGGEILYQDALIESLQVDGYPNVNINSVYAKITLYLDDVEK